jgi:OOP family OmpA-OmpF porin
MKHLSLLILFIMSTSASLLSQQELKGVWQGLMVRDGIKEEQGMILYAQFEITDGSLSGKTRNEVYDTDLFAIKRLKGTASKNSLIFTEFVIEKKKNSTKTSWCNISSELTYNDSTGYLTGRYTSSDCKRNTGKIILYRSTAQFAATEEQTQSHLWVKNFLYTFKKGYPAQEIREKERKEFKFQPVYFDYDQAEIRQEYIPFLTKMARVVDGHSDLRIKVTGHTDGDGSDAYNMELSKRRAEGLVEFFVSKGLSKDRIVIEFKGEKEPIDTNATPEGKQNNRRVDFSFI